MVTSMNSDASGAPFVMGEGANFSNNTSYLPNVSGFVSSISTTSGAQSFSAPQGNSVITFSSAAPTSFGLQLNAPNPVGNVVDVQLDVTTAPRALIIR